MVVFIDDKEFAEQQCIQSPADLLDTLSKDTTIEQMAEAFLTRTDQERISSNLLFICQGEYGVADISHSGQIKWIGTAGATTCHIVVVHDNETVALTHVDSPDAVDSTLEKMTCSMGNELSLYVIGGFSDDSDTSHPISSALLTHFCSSDKRFNIQLWCTLELNTRLIDNMPHPIFTDIAFNLENTSIHNVAFNYRGPALELRNLSKWNSKEYSSFFDSVSGFIEIPFFEFEMDSRYLGAASASDEFLLSNCSTSPHCEPDYFCQDMRNLFRFIATMNSDIIFGPNKLPVRYQMDNEGNWERKYSNSS